MNIEPCGQSEDEKPLAIDLFAGLGGWTEGLLAEGFRVVGFDITQHVYGEHRYPAQLVIQDVLTLHGSQFKNASLIVASPPCQEYSYMAMPWKRAKQIAHEYRTGVRDVKQLTALFDACFRIQREAIEVAGHHIPLVVENVRGAQPWVGRSRWNYGSFHFWGDVPALMPMTMKRGVKVGGLDWSKYGTPGYAEGPRRCFRDSAINNVSHSRGDDLKCGGDWFSGGVNASSHAVVNSRSPKRKMASAMIAKIPLPLSRHIGRVYSPVGNREGLVRCV